MAIVTIKSEWNILLSTAELRLVLKALGGRLNPNDVEAAKLLGDELTKQRVAATDTALHWNQKLLDNVLKGEC